MIRMQMGAEDKIDALRRHASGSEIREKRSTALMPIEQVGPFLIVADARVDQNVMAGCADDKGVKGHHQLMSFDIIETWIAGNLRGDHRFSGGVRKEEVWNAERAFQFNHANNVKRSGEMHTRIKA